jgi:LysM repeat protein
VPPKAKEVAETKPVYLPPQPSASKEDADRSPPTAKKEPQKEIVKAKPPAPKKPTPKAVVKAPAAPVKRPASNQYIVSKGDTLSGIASRKGVSLQALMRANKIRNPDQVIIGSKLVVPK